jgi:hypothetical protein
VTQDDVMQAAAPPADAGRAPGYLGTPPLPQEPALHAPEKPAPAQPLTGLIGLVFVVVLFFLLSFGAGGAEHSLEVLGPISTFALPVVAMVGFWWEDWPGTMLRAGWSGLTDTAIIAIAGAALTLLGQAVVSGVDLRALFNAEPGPGHVTTFPYTLPLAAGVFIAILQLSIVSEGWPLRGLGRIRSGLAALAVSCVIGLLAYLIVVGSGPVGDPGGLAAPGAYGAWLTGLGVWQLVFFVALRGSPFSAIKRRAPRLLTANVVVLGCAWVSYLVMRHMIGLTPSLITALCGSLIATLLIVAMLFEAWPWTMLDRTPGRTGVLITAVVLAAVLYWGLSALAGRQTFERRSTDDWVGFVALNGLGLGVILQVAVWRRWPARSETS